MNTLGGRLALGSNICVRIDEQFRDAGNGFFFLKRDVDRNALKRIDWKVLRISARFRLEEDGG